MLGMFAVFMVSDRVLYAFMTCFRIYRIALIPLEYLTERRLWNLNTIDQGTRRLDMFSSRSSWRAFKVICISRLYRSKHTFQQLNLIDLPQQPKSRFVSKTSYQEPRELPLTFRMPTTIRILAGFVIAMPIWQTSLPHHGFQPPQRAYPSLVILYPESTHHSKMSQQQDAISVSTSTVRLSFGPSVQ